MSQDGISAKSEETGELNAGLQEGDLDRIMGAIGRMARTQGMGGVALDTGLGRESLYKSMRAGASPEFSTVIKVLRALGLSLQAVPATIPEQDTAPSLQDVEDQGREREWLRMSEVRINRSLAIVGKSAFVSHFESLANFELTDQEVAGIIAEDLGCSNEGALTWRVRPARTLIRANMGKAALEIISRSRRLPEDITRKASELAGRA